jgi:hypothetical protein
MPICSMHQLCTAARQVQSIAHMPQSLHARTKNMVGKGPDSCAWILGCRCCGLHMCCHHAWQLSQLFFAGRRWQFPAGGWCSVGLALALCSPLPCMQLLQGSSAGTTAQHVVILKLMADMQLLNSIQPPRQPTLPLWQ